MACYVDTSVWIALLGRETTAPSIAQWLAQGRQLLTSTWTAVEVASGLGIKVRRGEFAPELAQTMCGAYEKLLVSDVSVITVDNADMQQAQWLCMQTQRGLRAGDALHLALAQRNNCSHFFSLDQTLNRNAQGAGMQLISLEPSA
jgi:uncharacterized protein